MVICISRKPVQVSASGLPHTTDQTLVHMRMRRCFVMNDDDDDDEIISSQPILAASAVRNRLLVCIL